MESSYAEFANHFLQKFAIPCVEAFLHMLEVKRQVRRECSHSLLQNTDHMWY